MEEKLSFRCANCGETVEFQIPSNWRDAEVKDLDGRPKETEKFSIARAIQKCPKCHYVSFDISKNIIKDKNILTTPEYNEILENNSLPDVVNDYLALGFAYEKQEEFYNSSRAYLCASWLLESIGKVKDSKSLLDKSAFCLLLYINSKPFKENPDLAAYLCAVDILRQIEKFDNAKKLANFALNKTKSASEKNILEYELLLCSEKISQSKEIPEYIESPTTLKQIIAEFLNVEFDDNLRKLRVFNQMSEFLKKCKVTELKEGVSLIEDMSAHTNFSDSQIETLKKIVGNGIELYSKVDTDAPQEVENLSKRIIYKIDNAKKSVEEIKANTSEENDGIIADTLDDLNVEKNKNLDIVYLDEEFEELENETAEEVENLNNLEVIDEPADSSVEEVPEVESEAEEIEEPEETELSSDTEEPEQVEETEAPIEPEVESEAEESEVPDVTEEPEAEEPEETDVPSEPEVPEVQIEAEDVEQVEEPDDTEVPIEPEVAEVPKLTEPTVEVEKPTTIEVEKQPSNDDGNKEIILTLASFDGKISIGEVQSLFECSYTKAKDLLDAIVKDGKLAWTIDEEVFNFVAK